MLDAKKECSNKSHKVTHNIPNIPHDPTNPITRQYGTDSEYFGMFVTFLIIWVHTWHKQEYSGHNKFIWNILGRDGTQLNTIQKHGHDMDRYVKKIEHMNTNENMKSIETR